MQSWRRPKQDPLSAWTSARPPTRLTDEPRFLDRPIRQFHKIVYGLADLEEPLKLEIVYVVVHERRLRDMAQDALPLSHEDFLTGELLPGSFRGIEVTKRVKLGRGRKIDNVLHLRHHRHLVVAVEQVDALALRARLVAVEIGGALLELGEILDRTQGTLGAVDLLIEQTSQTGGIDPKAIGLRPDIGREVKRRVGVKIGVTIKTSHTATRLGAFAIFGLIEFLLRKRRQQQA